MVDGRPWTVHNHVSMLPATFQLPAAVLLLAAGLLACFVGHRLFRVVLGIYGFVTGALIASSLMGTSDTVPMIIAAVVGGLAGAVILLLAYFVGVALAGAAVAVVLVNLVAAQIGREPHIFVVIAAAILGAFGALAVQRYVIVVATAFGGAWTALWGGVTLADGFEVVGTSTRGGVWLPDPMQPAPDRPWFMTAWLALGVAGVLVQLFVTARRGK